MTKQPKTYLPFLPSMSEALKDRIRRTRVEAEYEEEHRRD